MEMDNQPNQPQQQPTNPTPGPAPAPNPTPPPGPSPAPAPGPTPGTGPMPPQPQQPMNSQGGTQMPHQEKTDVLGIISLILIIFFPLAGMIVGIIGVSKAKREGYSKTLSMVGAIVNTILVVIGAIFFIFWLSVFSSIQDTKNEIQEQSNELISQAESEPYEVSYTSELGKICEAGNWPTNLQSSSQGNIVGIFSNSSTFPDSYSTEYVTLDSEFEDVSSSDPSTVDSVVCITPVGQEPIRVIECDLEVDDEVIKAPMSLRPYQATVYDAASKAEIGSFTAQPEDDCPFFVMVSPDDNSFDARLDEDSFNTELAKVL